jgi:hypothetical protein
MFAQSAQTAKDCENAQQATYAMVAKEAENLHVGGDAIMIDSTNHYVILYQRTQGPEKGIIFDLAHHTVMGVDGVSMTDGNTLVAPPAEGGGRRDRSLSCLAALHMQESMGRLETRLGQLETKMASFMEI